MTGATDVRRPIDSAPVPPPLGGWPRRSRRTAVIAGAIVTIGLLVVFGLALWLSGDIQHGDQRGLRTAVAQYLELQQSVYVPNTSNSPTWPSLVPSHSTIPPVVDSNGDPSLTPAMQASMIAAAQKAFTVRDAPGHSTDWWISEAIHREAQGYQVVGAGSQILNYHVDSLTSAGGTVTTTTDDWQDQVYGTGRTVHRDTHSLEHVTLIRSDGKWLVSYFTATYAPGYSP